MIAVSARPTMARRFRALATWLLLALGAVAVQRWILPWLREDLAGAAAAHWIWVATDRFELQPVAFQLLRDFEVPTPPPGARLLVLGDGEYSLFLNGQWVGASRYLPGDGLDQWEVGPWLRPGINRIVVDLASGEGPGGFVARLVGSDGRQLVATDDTWRVFRSAVPSLEPVVAQGEWERPVDLGRSPVGRWGTPRVGAPRPALGKREYDESRAVRYRSLGSEAWLELDGSPSPSVRLGRALTFDWGQSVAGFLALEFASAEGRPGLVVFGDAPPIADHPPADALVLRVPGRSYWLEALPRRFRYATVICGDELVDAKVYVTESARTPSELRTAAVRGVLGIAPPPLRAPVEDEIWRQLESLPGGAGREVR